MSDALETEAPLITAWRTKSPAHAGHGIAEDPMGGEWCRRCGVFIGFPPLGKNS